MLQLSIDVNEGASVIPCPRCGQALLLGYEKMGKLIVLYDGPVKRSRGPALLVCPEEDCTHQEPVLLVKDSLDAVAFDPFGAGDLYTLRVDYRHRSIAEMDAMIKGYKQRYRQTQNPKLPSLIRLWRQRFEFTCSSVTHSVHQAHREKKEIHLVGPKLDETGYIKSIKQEGVFLQRSQTQEEVFCEAGELHSAYVYARYTEVKNPESTPGTAQSYGNLKTIYTPTRFAVVNGETFALEKDTFYGRVRLSTKDASLGRSFGFVQSTPDRWVGEWPVGLIERAYRRIRLCHVGGFRIPISSETTNPDVFEVQTKRLDAADVLRMPICRRWATMRGIVPTHYRFYHRSEVDRIEELQVPCKLQLPRERVHRKR